MTPRVRAPELRGRGWLNTGGRELTLADLRGKIVLLDFWTFCCINCLHVLDELRPLEEKYGDVLVVIGVHSPKFEHERDPEALAAAVERYGVHHPVLDDPELRMWQQYAAKAWPTLAVVDPTGYLVASMAGEGHAEGLARLIDELIATHEAKGTLHRGDGPYVPPAEPRDPAALPRQGDRAARRQPAGLRLGPALAGRARAGRRDGGPADRRGRARAHRRPPADAPFSEPQGLCLLPAAERPSSPGTTCVVADTVNHLLRGRRLDDRRGRHRRRHRPAVALHRGRSRARRRSPPTFPRRGTWPGTTTGSIVAMAGIHQLWWFDPVKRTAGVYAGTTVEALRDGPLPDVWMAQPSGLSTSADGDRLWIADSETSAPCARSRTASCTPPSARACSTSGTWTARPRRRCCSTRSGVGALPDGSVLVADTYNGAVRRFDPSTGAVSTVADGLAEPSDIVRDRGRRRARGRVRRRTG